MGSYDNCSMTGYICRLCSELNKNVIHIYSDKGREMGLAEMINYIPISVSPYDSLPQTVCKTCIEKLEQQYRLVEQIKRARQRFLQQARAGNQNHMNVTECPFHDTIVAAGSTSSSELNTSTSSNDEADEC